MPHRENSDIAGDDAERRPCDAFDEERKDDMSVADYSRLALRRRQSGEEKYDGGPIIEKRLAGDESPERTRYSNTLEQTVDRDRIRRRENRPEHEAPRQRHHRSREVKRAEDAEGEEHGRDHHANRRKAEDGPGLALQLTQVHMKARGEEQQGQHAIEKDARQMRALNPVLGALLEIEGSEERADRHDEERSRERAAQQRDDARPSQITLVHDADDRGEDEDERSHIEGRHEAISPTLVFKDRRGRNSDHPRRWRMILSKYSSVQFYSWK